MPVASDKTTAYVSDGVIDHPNGHGGNYPCREKHEDIAGVWFKEGAPEGEKFEAVLGNQPHVYWGTETSDGAYAAVGVSYPCIGNDPSCNNNQEGPLFFVVKGPAPAT